MSEKVSKYRFEEGEITLPVSHIYKQFINQVLNTGVNQPNEIAYDLNVIMAKRTLENDPVFKLCSKEFKEEVHAMLDKDFYEMSNLLGVKRERPFEKEKKEIPSKPNLTLVK